MVKRSKTVITLISIINPQRHLSKTENDDDDLLIVFGFLPDILYILAGVWLISY